MSDEPPTIHHAGCAIREGLGDVCTCGAEEQSFDYNSFAFHFIASLRGGLPEQCDFCGKRYGLIVHHTTKHGNQRAEPTEDVQEAIDWRDHLEYERGFPAWITQRYPIPEEAGEWACNECFARWRAEGHPHD